MDVRIGITTSYNEDEQRLHHAYVKAVERAGGLPMIVPMLEHADNVRAFVELLHGLIITGGPAVTEGLVGPLPEDIDETDPVRVRSDRAVLEAFLEARKPILGICYGMQLLNASSGGTIYGDVQKHLDGALSHSEKRGGGVHGVDLEETSHLFRVLKKKRIDVNTRHIQALASVGGSFRVAAKAADGVIEAIENEDGSILGVQFHPERMGDEMLPLFHHLVENARNFALPKQDGT